MSTFLAGLAVFLLLNLAAGLWRVWRGPSAADRMSAVLLFGSTTVALLLVLAELGGEPALRDVALVFVMLAAILSVAFVGLPRTRNDGRGSGR
ncbi:monovalent cation/H+ antiporter complex subunit F [Alkalisalibacterium limincola]|uniref:PH regulation protein F n=1 Tax=Alkalisalibacterium limincola TaxID=2699169 RepID=A0A5C8KZ95_9GAMM|nr:monovalent cation/H+ antiporter complex subunit F [Alkalisalibacterium limincola]TXK65782.1 pH regulation protein F [Alkalisalibacterium limincola]